MNKPCNHSPPKPGCRLCWLFEHDARYRQLWGGDPGTVTALVAQAPTMFEADRNALLQKIKEVIRKPCQSLGMALETKASCGCGGVASLLHECQKFDRCRPYAPRQKEVRQCIECSEYQAKDQA